MLVRLLDGIPGGVWSGGGRGPGVGRRTGGGGGAAVRSERDSE